MKVKEKLAEDNAEKYRIQVAANPDIYRDNTFAKDCFLAGFEKAREMASDEISEIEGIDYGISNLGEEEVSE